MNCGNTKGTRVTFEPKRSPLPPGQLFKTVSLRAIARASVAVIPGDMELDLKALAAVSGNRKIHLAPVRELQKLTGYMRGGVKALAAKKAYPVYADKRIGVAR